MSSLADRFAEIRSRMESAAARAGRKAGEIELVAVSKKQPAEALRAAFEEAGQTLFGESRLQEARAKQPELPGRLRWHFIGHLQKNKIRAALPHFELFHGLESLDTAQQFQRIAAEEGLLPRVLLEVNVAGEASKFGFQPAALPGQLEALLALDRLSIEGLMCIPPPVAKAEDARRYFVALRELRDRLQSEARFGLPILSMGMSGDFEVAIEEGATHVRVGTALFGERKKEEG
ncbi:MAG: YggS family pyridoxal phosphate-dependent enzyme [Verrucomicrobia bacterium]|nr:YggS family pyridoxal phosphate-dependent enzyme [Verrucomicrobiota bacterium]